MIDRSDREMSRAFLCDVLIYRSLILFPNEQEEAATSTIDFYHKSVK